MNNALKYQTFPEEENYLSPKEIDDIAIDGLRKFRANHKVI